MDKIKKTHFSQHSINRQIDREISVEMMKGVVNYPDEMKKQYRGMHGGIVYKFSKAADNKTLVVVAEVKRTECWMISAYFKWDT